MRYLGNKTSLLNNIKLILQKHGLLNKKYKFFDAFCGTGSVAFALKDYFDLILNDNLLSAVIYSKGRIVQNNCTFDKLKVNPFDFINTSKKLKKGFFYNNYAPSVSKRMYFSDFNAGRIDYIRDYVEKWHTEDKINSDEYAYLLSCLLESLSKVGNVAGVYGAYLKEWDQRAMKEISFEPFVNNNSNIKHYDVKCFNSNIEDIIFNVDCDILYIDPPYTKNSYSVQYHILETLIRNDNPAIKGITGARQYNNISNAWSKHNEVEICFDKIIAKTNAKYILFSYSSDGLMAKEYIMNVLKRYCLADSIECTEIPYKKYINSKTHKSKEHYEYIFYAQKKDYRDVEYYSPLNYMGGKSNAIQFIKPYFKNKTKFIDLMGGGFNVGINAFDFKEIIYNDINHIVGSLVQMFQQTPTIDILTFIDRIIKKYSLEKKNKTSYLKLRNDYNEKYIKSKYNLLYLYVLILFGFQQQIRFNSELKFNNPVGKSGYNDSIKEKIISFSRRLKEMNVSFYFSDYSLIEKEIDTDTLLYIDPPYLITLGSYNDGKRGFNGWNKEEERRLISFIDKVKKKDCKILISNMLDYKGKSNQYLYKWIRENKISKVEIPVRNRNEILICVNI